MSRKTVYDLASPYRGDPVRSNPSDDVVATIALELRANGAMSVSGNIGDVKLAIGMLEGALDVLRPKLLRPKKRLIIPGELEIPASDLEIVHDPAFPVRPFGDTR